MQALVNFLTRIFGPLVRLGHSTGNRNLESDFQQRASLSKPASLHAVGVSQETQAQASPGAEDQLDLQPARELHSQPGPQSQSKAAKPASGNMSQKTSSASHPWHDLSAGEVSSVPRIQLSSGTFSAVKARQSSELLRLDGSLVLAVDRLWVLGSRIDREVFQPHPACLQY